MYNLEVYNALTEALAAHNSVVKYSEDVVTALEEKLTEAKATLAHEQEVHEEIRLTRRRFSPNAIDRILADGKLEKRQHVPGPCSRELNREVLGREGGPSKSPDEDDTEGSLAVLKVLNIVE